MKSLPVPAGTAPKVTPGRPTSAWAISLSVPSPPTPTIRRAPRDACSAASSVAWPFPRVSTTSPSAPWRDIISFTIGTQAAPKPLPAIGLTMNTHPSVRFMPIVLRSS